MQDNSTRPEWTSKIGFILAAVGSAVGLGNIWRFPYIMGKYGGSAFLLVYLLIILFVCSLPLICELSFGKRTKKENVGAYGSVNPKLKIFGWLNVITATIIASFYFVIGGWLLNYIYINIANTLITDYAAYFGNFVSSPILPCILTILFLLMVMFFIFRGVNKGIEFINKVMMPLFLLIIIILCIFSISLPNATEGLKFMFMPDFSKINGEMLLAALGQTLFTLSIGMGILLVYGSYMKKKENTVKSAYTIIFSDTLFALLAAIMIFPAAFSFGLDVNSGAGLAFITLPNIFSQLPYGNIFAVLFFVLLFFAAFTSSISIVEVPTAALIENFKISRNKAASIVSVAVFVLAVPVTLSMGIFDSFKIFGLNLFDFFDYITSNILLPLNTIILCIVIGWFVKLRNIRAFHNKTIYAIFNFLLRFVTPVALTILILFGTILKK